MMKVKKIVPVAVMAGLCFALTGCGTTVGQNTETYFAQTKKVINNLFSGSGDTKKASSDSTAETAGTQLAAPTDFTVDASGNYSFTGSDGAEYYLFYFCTPDATEDGDTFVYSSSPIYTNESNVYSGNCADLFEYAYGEYLVKVFAFQDLTDSTRSMSTAATTDYVYSGEQSAPEIYYYWNSIDKVMGVQVANMSTYLYEAYPDQVDVTFTNTGDASDTVTITISDVSADAYEAQSADLTQGATYNVTAVATSTSPYVTNATSDTTQVAEELTLGQSHIYTPGYTYVDGFANNIFFWPIVQENFDPVNGGEVGTAPGAFGNGSVVFSAAPTDARDGALYSYDLSVAAMMPLVGKLDLYADGTFTASDEGQGPMQTSNLKGYWVENEDGTLNLSYDHSTIEIQ
jgi:hypothetical protein